MNILFLIMSADKPEYLSQEEEIRKTWGKDILEGKYPNINLVFYRGNGDNTLVDHVLKLRMGDELDNTYEKTISAIRFFYTQYDFIVRCNTSLWVNVDLILETLENMNPNERNLYGGALVVNGISRNVPFIRGQFMIFNRTLQDDLLRSYGYICNSGIDDVCIAMNLNQYYIINHYNYLNCIKAVPYNNFKEGFDSDILKTSFYVRITEYIKEGNDNPLYIIHSTYVKPETKINVRLNKFTTIETIQGVYPITY